MIAYKLKIDEFSNDDYSLIGIHTTLEDYQLAYLINKHLDVKLAKGNYNLELKKDCPVCSIYDFEDVDCDCFWILISNRYITSSKKQNLFNEIEVATYLIPEKKKVNYFLKIEGGLENELLIKNIERINQIPQIIASYEIDATTLKSKKNLIF